MSHRYIAAPRYGKQHCEGGLPAGVYHYGKHTEVAGGSEKFRFLLAELVRLDCEVDGVLFRDDLMVFGVTGWGGDLEVDLGVMVAAPDRESAIDLFLKKYPNAWM